MTQAVADREEGMLFVHKLEGGQVNPLSASNRRARPCHQSAKATPDTPQNLAFWSWWHLSLSGDGISQLTATNSSKPQRGTDRRSQARGVSIEAREGAGSASSRLASYFCVQLTRSLHWDSCCWGDLLRQWLLVGLRRLASSLVLLLLG